MSEIRQTAKAFILENFRHGVPEDKPRDTVLLITSGIVESLGPAAPGKYLARTFGVTLKIYETGKDHLGTLNGSERLGQSKR